MLTIGRINEFSATTSATAPKSAERATETKDTTMASEHTDKFIKSGVSFTPAYTKAAVTDNKTGTTTDNEAADKEQEQALKQDPEKNGNKEVTKFDGIEVKNTRAYKNQLMADMVKETLTGQANHAKKNSAMTELEEIIRSYGKMAEETANGDEDYWNAENTANRILDFAKSLAGDDADAIETLRKAFEKGFGECDSIFGGKLPSVCQDTYDLVQEGFDAWAKEVSGEIEAEAETIE